MSLKRVFIVDDHTAIREGYKAILERSGRYRVDGEASTAEAAIEALLGRPTPEILIVDISLPGMSGLSFCQEFRKRSPETPIVILSMHRRFDYIVGAFRAGASAYVSKDAGAESIIAALDSATSGLYFLDPQSLRLFVDEAAASTVTVRPQVPGQAKYAQKADRPDLANLSDREREVLGLLSAGRRAEEIAALLSLSQKTVENHLSNITTKLGVRDRFELYRFAARLDSEGS
jgi:DNA-binding NarL/FixJ family response regulator